MSTQTEVKSRIEQLKTMVALFEQDAPNLLEKNVKSASVGLRKNLTSISKLANELKKDMLAHQKTIPTKKRTSMKGEPVITQEELKQEQKAVEDMNVSVTFDGLNKDKEEKKTVKPAPVKVAKPVTARVTRTRGRKK